MPSRESARTPRQVFGGMVRYYREQAGLSRPELARQISKSESLVQAIELGQRAATPQVTGDLETALWPPRKQHWRKRRSHGSRPPDLAQVELHQHDWQLRRGRSVSRRFHCCS